VHWGCWSGYLSVRTALLDRVSSLATKYPDYTVTSSGYSYGAPLAFYAGVDAKMLMARSGKKNKVEVMAFGSPRVGDVNTASMAFRMFAKNEYVRVVQKFDTYPHIPPESLGFMHAGQELWNTPTWATPASAPSGVDISKIGTKNPLNLPSNTWIQCSKEFGEDPYCSSSIMDPQLDGSGWTSESNHHEYWTYMTCAKGEEFYAGVKNPDGSAPSGFDADNGGNIVGGSEQVKKVQTQVWGELLAVLGKDQIERFQQIQQAAAQAGQTKTTG